MEKNKTYALVISVGDYDDVKYKNLPTYKNDAALISTGLNAGLKVPDENIRTVLGEDENGYVSMREFARCIKSFSMLDEDDDFILYFSGHGSPHCIALSDGEIDLESIVAFLKALKCKAKAVIVDCCYAGSIHLGAGKNYLEDKNISDYVGKGIEVIASTSENDISRLSFDKSCSLFTCAFSVAMMQPDLVINGKVSLGDICDRAREVMSTLGEMHPESAQNPVIRTDMSGTLYFDVKDVQPKEINAAYSAAHYDICYAKPRESASKRGLSIFAKLREKASAEELAGYTLEILKISEQMDVLQKKRNDEQPKWETVWVYFGCDDDDMKNHSYFAYTIWADKRVRDRYYKLSGNAVIEKEVLVRVNRSYEVLKRMSVPSMSCEEYILSSKALLFSEMKIMDSFSRDLQEVFNQTFSLDELAKAYVPKADEMEKHYLSLSNLDAPPADLREWADEIVLAAGSVMDMARILRQIQEKSENKADDASVMEREIWSVKDAIRRYSFSLERIREIEEKMAVG